MRWRFVFVLGLALLSSLRTTAQNNTNTSSPASSNITADYPTDRPGVLIQGRDWTAIPSVMPFKTHVKHGLAASFTYGAVPAAIVADYDGPHAAVQVPPGRPVICICQLISTPGSPVLVRLHLKKKFRELDGGRLPIMGSKIAQAKKNDLIPADVSQPESTVWLVRPQQALAPGEYALMLGTQNINIFPFTVSESGTGSPTTQSKKP